METVEVVIRIPKDLYEGIECRNGELETEYVCDELMKAVDNGTPLPKGHGDLKDYDAIKSDYIRKISVFMSEEERMDLLCTIVDEAEAVIKADKEADNEC